MSAPEFIEQSLGMSANNPPLTGWFAVGVVLRYDPAEPATITASICAGDVWVDWVFGRRLLDDGLCGMAGIGDVAIWPEGDGYVHIRLTSPDGVCVLRAPAKAVEQFLLRTYAVVSIEAEAGILDAIIEAETYTLLVQEL
jgi:hypothetical protein